MRAGKGNAPSLPAGDPQTPSSITIPPFMREKVGALSCGSVISLLLELFFSSFSLRVMLPIFHHPRKEEVLFTMNRGRGHKIAPGSRNQCPAKDNHMSVGSRRLC